MRRERFETFEDDLLTDIELLRGRSLVVVSNHNPFHLQTGNDRALFLNPGRDGLTALFDLVDQSEGTWINLGDNQGDFNADEQDELNIL